MENELEILAQHNIAIWKNVMKHPEKWKKYLEIIKVAGFQLEVTSLNDLSKSNKYDATNSLGGSSFQSEGDKREK